MNTLSAKLNLLLPLGNQEELKAIAPECITRHHGHHYLGFARNQWRLFEKEQPHRIKPLLYVYRVLLTGIHLMRSGAIEANLPRLNEKFSLPYIDDLIARKRAGAEQSTLEDTDYAFHQLEYDRLLRALEEAHIQSKLAIGSRGADPLNDLLVRLRLSSLAPEANHSPQ